MRSRRGNCAAGAVCFGLLGRVTTSLVTQPRSSSSLVSCLISDHVGPSGAGGVIILVPEEGPQILDICGSQSWGLGWLPVPRSSLVVSYHKGTEIKDWMN